MIKLTDKQLDKLAGQIAAKIIETDIGQRADLYEKIADKLRSSSQHFTATAFDAIAKYDRGQ